jgi:GNAT superfamily N-acetyltransferase
MVAAHPSLPVQNLTPEKLEKAQEFLEFYEETTQFLLGNLADHGPYPTEHPNSGQFKVIEEGAQIRAVFCLTRRGNLLAQSDWNMAGPILGACAAEAIPIQGFVGDWATIAPIWAEFRTAHPDFPVQLQSKEILFRRTLPPVDLDLIRDPRVRGLTAKDYDSWRSLHREYQKEMNLPEELSDSAIREDFVNKAELGFWWGWFEADELLSMASLNSASARLGQVGGVYTVPKARSRGLSRATMRHLLADCRDHQGHSKSILFTGEENRAAQAVYRSVGYAPIGHFALILGRR